MLVSVPTVVITYSAVFCTSTMSSRTAKISLPLFAFSRRNSAKLDDTNCVAELVIIKEVNYKVWLTLTVYRLIKV